MDFNNTPPKWDAQGVEPTEEIQTKGFQAGYKPPAAYFNYLFNKITTCLKEIQEKLKGHAEDTSNPHSVTKAQVGLGNVDNTADANKSVKYATSAGTAETCTGNAATATKLATARTVSLTGSVTGSGTFDGSGNLSIATNTNHTHSVATTSANGFMSASDKTKLDGVATGANNYSLPTASSSTLGGVKTGSNITNSSGTISLTKSNVTSALGYTPPTTNTTYGVATQSANGLMSASDKTKLDGVATGANKTTVDSSLSSTSTNPVQNKVVNSALAGKASSSHTHSNYASKSVYGDTAISIGNIIPPAISGSGGKWGNTGSGSIEIGKYVNAYGANSQAFGIANSAKDYQCVIGKAASSGTATTSSSNKGGSIFVIGNGRIYSDGTGLSQSNAFRVIDTGIVYSNGSYNSSGADYAEYEEWADGNITNEDRVGFFVTYDENSKKKIRKANAGEWILGVVSGQPCVIGNSDEHWMGRYILDDFGRFIEETFEYEEIEIDSETGDEITVTKTGTKWKENPAYDKEREYISRSERPEWDAVGWVGVLNVRDDGTCKPNGFCKCADGGIATSATLEDFSYLTPIFRVIDRVTDNVVRAAIRF